jgi:hypothetical protein
MSARSVSTGRFFLCQHSMKKIDCQIPDKPVDIKNPKSGFKVYLM